MAIESAADHMQAIFPLLSNPVTNTYSIIAILLIFGILGGYLAQKIHLPTITGNIFAGLLLDPIFGIINISSKITSEQLEPITDLALSLIAISIGSHLKMRKLHNAFKRISFIVLTESLIVPLLVGTSCYFIIKLGNFNIASPFQAALFLGILSIATGPGTIIHVVEECRAKGLFVKTLIAVVVLNNVVNIGIFELAREYFYDSTVQYRFFKVVRELLGAGLLGSLVAWIVISLRHQILGGQRLATFAFSMLMITHGLALELGLSTLIATLSLGVVLANYSDRNPFLEIFEDFEPVIYTLFFTMTGAHASFIDLSTVGSVATVYFIARNFGNIFSVYFSSKITHMPGKVGKYLGLSLMPQAGITIGLLLHLQAVNLAEGSLSLIIPVVLSAVTISEIIGPIVLRFTLHKSKEVNHALPRLISFIQEEYITVNIKSKDKEGVIKELVDFLFRTRNLSDLDKEHFFQTVIARERASSTALGKSIAIPHATIPGIRKIIGVIGISKEGIDWGSPDNQPVHMIILVGTSPSHQEQYLGVISTISHLFSEKTVISRNLHKAKNAAEVYEAIADEEFEHLNRILEHV